MKRAGQGRALKLTRPLGYTTADYVIESKAEVVKEIYRLFSVNDGTPTAVITAALSGKSGKDIAASLLHLLKFSRALVFERTERRAAEGLVRSPCRRTTLGP